ncbi:MAG: cytochrome c oxidase subunit 3, partial [Pseudomonadales bacterium]
YLLTGIHFMHLCVGVGFLLYLRQLAVRGATPSADIMIFEVGGVYWHLVDLLWIIIFPLLYLIR